MRRSWLALLLIPALAWAASDLDRINTLPSLDVMSKGPNVAVQTPGQPSAKRIPFWRAVTDVLDGKQLPLNCGTLGQICALEVAPWGLGLLECTDNADCLAYMGAGVGGIPDPGSSTDDALVRWNGSNADAVQNSAVILTDAGAMSGPASLDVTGHAAFGANASVNADSIIRTEETFTTTGEKYGERSKVTLTPGTVGYNGAHGGLFEFLGTGGTQSVNWGSGVYGKSDTTQNAGWIAGGYFEATARQSTLINVDKLTGMEASAAGREKSVITDLVGGNFLTFAANNSDVTNMYGVKIETSKTSSIAPDKIIGLSIGAVTGGTENWAIQSAGGQSYHAGPITIGAAQAPAAGIELYVSGDTKTDTLKLEETGAGGQLITVQAPASITAAYSLTLPGTDGNASEVLTTDGNGVTSWTTVSGGSGYSTIQDNGVAETQRTILNLTGAGVSCVDNAGLTKTDCTISGGAADGLGPDGDKGDVTVGGTGTTLTIDADAVVFAKMQNSAAGYSVVGKSSTGAGNFEEITAADGQVLRRSGTSLGFGTILPSAVDGPDLGKCARFSNTGTLVAATGDCSAGDTGGSTITATADNLPDQYAVPFLSTPTGTVAVYSDTSTGPWYNPFSNTFYAKNITGTVDLADASTTVKKTATADKCARFDASGILVAATGDCSVAGGTTVNDASPDDTTTWVLLAGNQTGSQNPLSDAGLTYNDTADSLDVAGELAVGSTATATGASLITATGSLGAGGTEAHGVNSSVDFGSATTTVSNNLYGLTGSASKTAGTGAVGTLAGTNTFASLDTTTNADSVVGSLIGAYNYTGKATSILGVDSSVSSISTNASTTMKGLNSYMSVGNTGLVTTGTGIHSTVHSAFTGAFTTAYGLRSTMSLAGADTTSVALKLDSVTGATDNWAIQSEGGQSYHVGNLRIGSTVAPDAALAVTGAAKISTSLDVPKLANLTTNGFVKTSGGDGTLSVSTTVLPSEVDGVTASKCARFNASGTLEAASGDCASGDTTAATDGLGPDGDKGDVAVGGTGTTLTVDPDAIVFSKMQNSAAGLSVVGKSATGAGDFAEITAGADGNVLRRTSGVIGFGTIVPSAVDGTDVSKCARFDASGILIAASGDCASGDTGYQTIQDEAGALTQRTAVNFTGAGVSCVDNAGSTRTDCTISGAASSTNADNLLLLSESADTSQFVTLSGDAGDSATYRSQRTDNQLLWNGGTSTLSTTNVSATTFTGALTGNASTATALATDPTDCTTSQAVNGMSNTGTLSCGKDKGLPFTYVLSTDATKSNNTLALVPDLDFTVYTNAKHILTGALYVVQTNTTPDFKILFDFPTGCTFGIGATSIPVGGGTVDANFITADNTEYSFQTVNGSTVILFNGQITCAGNGSPVTVKWAQNTTNAATTTLSSQSFFAITTDDQ